MTQSREWNCYVGMYPCPRCLGQDTATDIIATSGRWIKFHCYSCGCVFRKSSSNTSPLSAAMVRPWRAPTRAERGRV